MSAGTSSSLGNLPRLLVVDDEEKICRAIARTFTGDDWVVETAATAADAFALLAQETWDVVVLDWMLPDRSGIEVLEWMRREQRREAVLMLTAKDSIMDRVSGLEAGADDYLVKPFAMPELVARCRALLRRAQTPAPSIYEWGSLRLDRIARTVFHGEQALSLTTREYEILEYLFRQAGGTVTREMLQRDVWREPQRLTSLDNVIDVQMMRLRRKLDAVGLGRLIVTVRGLGYELGKVTS